MTNQEMVRKVQEALDRAKNRRQEITQKIRELQVEMDKENFTILSCLVVLDNMRKAEK